MGQETNNNSIPPPNTDLQELPWFVELPSERAEGFEIPPWSPEDELQKIGSLAVKPIDPYAAREVRRDTAGDPHDPDLDDLGLK